MAETRNRGRKIIQEFRVQLEEAARAKYGKVKSNWYISIGEKIHLTPRRVGGFFRGKSSDHATAIVEHLGLNPQKVLEYPGSPVLTSISVDIDWRQKCLDRLENQKSLTLNPLLNGRYFRIDDIHVPLGLIQEKKKSQSENFENSEKDTEIELFTHYRFLSDAIGGQKRRLAIVGEPGAGKTTLMVKIGEYIRDIGLGVPLWISLGLLAGRSITDYLRDEWIRGDLDLPEPLPIENELTSLIQFLKSNEIWLLLDGVDEMSATNTLDRLRSDLSKGWAESARSIVSCRLNVWYVDRQALGVGADVYQMQNFEIAADPAQDMTFQFTQRFFSRVEADKLASDGDLTVEQQQASERIGQTQALLLRQELLAPGKEKVRESVRNPLRLGLLCNIWDARQGLPETKAILYGRFVEWFYQWKDNLVHLSLAQRQDLNTKLGELARQGIDRAQLYFTEAEALVILGEEGWKLAKDVGWLNSLVRRGDEYIYGFYHATFQEYFAACSVSDWDFWLPRDHVDCPVPCRGEQQPTYRLFEKRWQEAILLWMGRDIDSERKEEFLEKITSFKEKNSQEEANKFYYYRAYCLAALCVGEFQSSRQSKSIVKQVVIWGFGYFDIEKQEWVEVSGKIVSLIQDILPLTHQEYISEALLPILFQNDSSDRVRSHAAVVLGQTARGDKETIKTLLAFLEKTNDYALRITTAEALGHVDLGNNIAINILIELLCTSNFDNYNLRLFTARSLSRITVGNKFAIKKILSILTQLVDQHAPEQYYYLVITILETIAIGDKETIKLVLSIFQSSSNNFIISYAAEALEIIAVGDQLVIDELCSILADIGLSDYKRFVTTKILGHINTSNEEVVSVLLSLFAQSSLDDFNVAEELERFGIGKTQVIKELSSMLDRLSSDHPRRFIVARTLGRINVGNKKAIVALLDIFHQSGLNDFSLCAMVRDLGQIAVSDKDITHLLIDLLSNSELSNSFRYSIAIALWNINVGNDKSIPVLLNLLSQVEMNDSFPYGTGESLNEIISPEMMPMIINKLKSQITEYVNESNQKRFYVCHTVIWKCAQTIPYAVFHAAWHSDTT
jgi:HEAT repeats/NACHT domain